MKNQNSKLLRKILVSYAVTFMIIKIADSLTMIVDGVVVSRGLGAKALAAIGLADPSYKIATLFAGVLSVGLQALCAQAMGSGDRKKANGIFSAGMIVTCAAAVLLTTLCIIFTGALCNVFGAGNDPELYDYLYRYLKGWFIGIPGYIVFFVLSPLVTLDGNKKNVTIATFIQSLINVGGDAISVFVLDAGTFGVGLATGLSYNLSACVLILNFFRKRSVFKPFSEKPDLSALPKTVRIGLPKITEQCCKILAPLLINRTIIAVGSSVAMSAISVKSSILGFCVIIGKAISESIGLMTQILYGEKDAVSLKQTIKSGLGLLFTLDTLFSALLFAFAGTISKLYFPSGAEEWILATRAVRCLALSLLLNGCNLIVIQYLQSTRRMKQVHFMTSFHRIISLSFFTLLLGLQFGTNGLFAAIPVSEAAVLLGYIVFAMLKNRHKDFTDSMLQIPDGFGYNSENSCSFSISTVKEAVEVSERIEAFCEQHHADKRKGYYSARCMEELATNIVEHGFAMDDKQHYCDIRVMLEPDEVVLRLRDDCPYFNIRERYDSLVDDDLETNLGIRLVYALAKEVNYINIFNTNTLIIRM